MSKTYLVICLAHSPALNASDGSHQSAADAVLVARWWHPRCLLAVEELSGGPIRVTILDDTRTVDNAVWVSYDWIRLLAATTDWPQTIDGWNLECAKALIDSGPVVD